VTIVTQYIYVLSASECIGIWIIILYIGATLRVLSEQKYYNNGLTVGTDVDLCPCQLRAYCGNVAEQQHQ